MTPPSTASARKDGGGGGNQPNATQATTAKTGGNTTKGDKVKYQKFEMNNAVITSTKSGGGSTGPTVPPKPTQGNTHR